MNTKNHATIITAKQKITEKLPVLLFLFSVFLSICTTYHVTGNFLDSDASSELVLAKQLAETGRILSRDWIYSTELRVFNTQLIYAPMFLLFNDWHLVRFFSAVTMQAIYILCYGFLLHQGGFQRKQFYISASLLLLPVSVAYGRIMLYHCYYIPHIALSFLLVGLFLGYARDTKRPVLKDCMRLGFLLVFSFLGALGGIRQLMITHAPMLLLIVLLCLMEDLHSSDTHKAAIFSRQKILLLTIALLALFAAFLGYKVNTDYLAYGYSFSSYNETNLGIPEFTLLDRLVYGFLHQFGFRKHMPMLSLLGILSLGSLPAAGFCLYLAVKNLFAHRPGTDPRKTMVFLFFLCYWTVQTLVFLITDTPDGYHYALYYVLCLPWIAPLLLSIPDHFPQNIHPFSFRRIFSWVTVLILFANGFANTAFFHGVEKFDQVYEGLGFQEKNKAAQMADLVNYLTENGYDAGYATFWEGNIVTELSDGKLPITNVDLIEDSSGGYNLCHKNWLTSQWQREAPKQKPFFVTRTEKHPLFESSECFQYCTEIYRDDLHCAYSIDNLEEFAQALYS